MSKNSWRLLSIFLFFCGLMGCQKTDANSLFVFDNQSIHVKIIVKEYEPNKKINKGTLLLKNKSNSKLDFYPGRFILINDGKQFVTYVDSVASIIRIQLGPRQERKLEVYWVSVGNRISKNNTVFKIISEIEASRQFLD